MVAALTAAAHDASALVVENAAESALEHHLAMTCDPVDRAGLVGFENHYMVTGPRIFVPECIELEDSSFQKPPECRAGMVDRNRSPIDGRVALPIFSN
jgi:hypothetical protein